MKSQFLFTIVLLCQLVCPAFVVDLSQHNKYGNSSILDTLCNKNTQIDFTFSSSSFMSCSTSSCSLKVYPFSIIGWPSLNVEVLRCHWRRFGFNIRKCIIHQ